MTDTLVILPPAISRGGIKQSRRSRVIARLCASVCLFIYIFILLWKWYKEYTVSLWVRFSFTFIFSECMDTC